jgi:hypothetical protein
MADRILITKGVLSLLFIFVLGPMCAIGALLAARGLATNNWRFSLRAVLVTMTLVAVVLSLAVCAVKNIP